MISRNRPIGLVSLLSFVTGAILFSPFTLQAKLSESVILEASTPDRHLSNGNTSIQPSLVTRYVGRSLNDVLSELNSQGYRIIYSSEHVFNYMTITRRPVRQSGIALINELVKQFQLKAEKLKSGHIVVRPASNLSESEQGAFLFNGRIINTETREPISGATIKLLPTDGANVALKATSDLAGRFKINLELKSYRIRIDAPGFYLETETLSKNKIATLHDNGADFLLSEIPLNTLVISTSRYDIEYFKSSNHQILNQEKIEELSHLANDLNRAAVHFPGIAGGDASAELRIRGGAPYENKYYLDGMPLENPFHLQGLGSFFGVIDSFTISDAKIITGGAPVNYGEHLSGIIDIQSSTIEKPYETSIGANFLDLKVKSSGTFINDDHRWFVSARRGFIDLVTETSEVEAEDIQPEYLDLFAKGSFRLSETSEVTASMLINLDKDTCITRCATALNSDSMANHFWLNFFTEWNDQISSKTLVGIAELENNRSGFEARQTLMVAQDSIELADEFLSVEDRLAWQYKIIKQDWQITPLQGQLIKTGFELKQLEADYLYNSTFQLINYFAPLTSQPELTIRSETLSPSGQTMAAYYSHLFKIDASLAIEAGIRWDKQDYTHDSQLSPRLNAQYLTNSGSSYRFSWGKFHQAQGIHQIAIEDGQDSFSQAEKVDQINFSYNTSISAHLNLSLGLYQKKYEKLRERFENILGIDNLFFEADQLRRNVAPESSTAKGIELSLSSVDSKTIDWSLHYSLSEARDSIEGKEVSRPWEQRHALSFIASYQTSESCNINWINSYHSGWKTTNVVINPELELYDLQRSSFIAGELYQKESPDYFRTDFRFGCESVYSDSRLQYFFEVLNLFNQKNSSGYDSVAPYFANDGRIYSVEFNGNSTLPLIPSIGFIWTF